MKITFRNHLRAFPWLAAVGLFMFFSLWMVRFDPLAIIIFSVGYAIVFLPVLYLHIEYYLQNRGELIEIERSGIQVYKYGQLRIKYSSNELEKIIFYKSMNSERSRLQQIPSECYFYARVIPTNEKEQIIITSLVTSGDLEQLYAIKGVKIEIKKTFFASINFPWVLPEFFSNNEV